MLSLERKLKSYQLTWVTPVRLPFRHPPDFVFLVGGVGFEPTFSFSDLELDSKLSVGTLAYTHSFYFPKMKPKTAPATSCSVIAVEFACSRANLTA